MTPLHELDLTSVRVLDGGMATELEAMGCDLLSSLWSAAMLSEQPESIEAVHASYLAAGADCILTASYQVSEEAFTALGLSAEQARAAAAEALQVSVRLAEHARSRLQPSRRVLIAASLGPYGAALHDGAEYHGNYDICFDALVSFHARRLAVLAGTGADLIAFETVPSYEEARAIAAALQPYPEIGAWVSFTCRDGSRVAHGESISECVRFLDAVPQLVAIGVNCTAPSFVSALVHQIKAGTTKPIVVYPNSGENWDPQLRLWSGRNGAIDFGALAGEWRAAGAQIIGGCCRTGPADIAAIRTAIDAPAARESTHI
jgi:homocysteine S-methyltransferase